MDPAGLRRPDSLRARIYTAVRERIRKGEFGRHDRLVDKDLARELGVSRMPAREALMQLMHEGYLVGSTRGFKIPQLSAPEITDIFHVRRLLEPEAAALAATAASASAATVLAASVTRAVEAVSRHDVEGLIEANHAFRQAWLQEVPNRRLVETIERCADQVLAVRHQTLVDAGVHPTVLAGLHALEQAFREHNAEAARIAMRRFIDQAEASFLAAERSKAVPPQQ